MPVLQILVTGGRMTGERVMQNSLVNLSLAIQINRTWNAFIHTEKKHI
jgi:hypothetical protein